MRLRRLPIIENRGRVLCNSRFCRALAPSIAIGGGTFSIVSTVLYPDFDARSRNEPNDTPAMPYPEEPDKTHLPASGPSTISTRASSLRAEHGAASVKEPPAASWLRAMTMSSRMSLASVTSCLRTLYPFLVARITSCWATRPLSAYAPELSMVTSTVGSPPCMASICTSPTDSPKGVALTLPASVSEPVPGEGTGEGEGDGEGDGEDGDEGFSSQPVHTSTTQNTSAQNDDLCIAAPVPAHARASEVPIQQP